MKLLKILGLNSVCLLVGLVYYGIQKGIIIIQMPWSVHNYSSGSADANQLQAKRQLMLYYWTQGVFKQEMVAVIDADNKADTVRYIVTNWLAISEQAGLLSKKIGLETVMFSSPQEIYISFDHSILSMDDQTYSKWMIIESLLKTLRASNMGIQRVNFLVHHQPLSDAHLDFSRAWPIQGFIGS